MASSFVANGNKDHHFHHHLVSPKNSFKKTGFANSQPPVPSCDHGHQHPGGALPKCVCAPATHAGSFKCRLHRVKLMNRMNAHFSLCKCACDDYFCAAKR